MQSNATTDSIRFKTGLIDYKKENYNLDNHAILNCGAIY